MLVRIKREVIRMAQCLFDDASLLSVTSSSIMTENQVFILYADRGKY